MNANGPSPRGLRGRRSLALDGPRLDRRGSAGNAERTSGIDSFRADGHYAFGGRADSDPRAFASAPARGRADGRRGGLGLRPGTNSYRRSECGPALEREGVSLQELKLPDRSSACRWVCAVAEWVASGGVNPCRGGVIFCDDAGLLCCVANKVAGLRAVVANTVPQAARATLTLGANLVAVDMPGRTFFEVRQILRTLCCRRGAPLARWA